MLDWVYLSLLSPPGVLMAWSQHKLNFIWKPFLEDGRAECWCTGSPVLLRLGGRQEETLKRVKRRRKRRRDGGGGRVWMLNLPWTTRTLFKEQNWWTLQIKSWLDGSQGSYCALLTCQQCQRFHVCVRLCLKNLASSQVSEVTPNPTWQKWEPKPKQRKGTLTWEMELSDRAPHEEDLSQTAPPAGQLQSLHSL